MTYLIVGLGDFGPEYSHTRHNLGFDTLDLLAEQLQTTIAEEKYQGKIGSGRFKDENEEIFLLKPKTGMNASGLSVSKAVKGLALPVSHVLLIQDDSDLGFGHIRIRKGGSAGTHRGTKSIISELGDDQFPRVRISIGSKPKEISLGEYVSSPFSKEQLPIIHEEQQAALSALHLMINGTVQDAMNQWNGWLAPSFNQK